MTRDDYNHFVCIVAGDNPEQQMEPYDKMKIGETKVVYRYNDADKLRRQYIEMYNALLNTKASQLSKEEIEEVRENIRDLESESADDFFYELTYDYEHDQNTGDAVTTKNLNGEWSSYRLGKFMSVPFILKDGREVFQARKNEIEWGLMHLHGSEIYEAAWDMVMAGKKPSNDYEQNIYDNMKNRTAYFSKFETKENYVLNSTAFWGYAFLSPETGWVELDEKKSQFEWVKGYYDKYIKLLPDDTLLTIFECVK